MTPIHHTRPAMRSLALGYKAYALGLKDPVLNLILVAALMAFLNNDLFQKFMRTCIKKFCDQAQVSKAKDKFNRPFKPRNYNYYYHHLNIKYYYFY